MRDGSGTEVAREGGVNVEHLAAILRSVADLVEEMDARVYATEATGLGIGSIGGHVRHAHDHVVALEGGVGGGLIDFDARLRGTEVERDPRAAVVRLRETADGLGRVDAVGMDREVRVRMSMCAQEDGVECRSTLGREVMFVLSHTVHHAAMIGAIARSLGFEVPAGFGVAASTTKHLAGEGG